MTTIEPDETAEEATEEVEEEKVPSGDFGTGASPDFPNHPEVAGQPRPNDVD